MTSTLLESKIERSCCSWAFDKYGIANVKIKDKPGWPDRAFLYKGKALFVEFKRPNEEPRPLQKAIHKQVINSGFTVLIIDSIPQFKIEIERWVNE